MNYPHFWNDAVLALSVDSHLGEIISRYTGEGMTSRGEAFQTLARSIVGQQISVKAAASVWNKLVEGLSRTFPVSDEAFIVSPSSILALNEEELRACGLSRMKAVYLHALANHFVENDITPDYWAAMSDEEVIADLTRIKGIGVWTAEMFLIFHLMRPDVFPLADIGLQKAVAKLYGVDPKNKKALLAAGERFRPYRSVATWYFWRSLDPVPVEY